MNRKPSLGIGRPVALLVFLTCFHLILCAFCEADQSWIRVERVVDGDTIILTDGRHVRYIGIDTPEIDHEHHRAEPMGYEARDANRHLVENWKLRLEFDEEKRDHYGRTLAYVYRSDGHFVNAELLERGFAHVLSHSPNIAREKTLLSAQREAMKEGRGVWKTIDRNARPAHGCLGNRRSKRFHAYDCKMGNEMSKKNRIRFKNQWEAFWQGYSPDKACIVFPGDD